MIGKHCFTFLINFSCDKILSKIFAESRNIIKLYKVNLEEKIQNNF